MRTMRMAGRLAGVALVASALFLTGCAHGPAGQRQARSVPVERGRSGAASPSEDVWHVRIALNVAALSCRGRGRVPVAGAYGRVLSRHASLLQAAYAAEQRRYGREGYDKHATRMYNRFANQHPPEKFCAAASDVARQVAAMDSASFGRSAPGMLGHLRRWAG